MIRQSARTGRTFSTSSIQREVIQAHGHSGSNQNCTSSRDCAWSVMNAPTRVRAGLFLVTYRACGRLGGLDNGDYLKADQIAPPLRPQVEQRRIAGLHELEAAIQAAVLNHPAVNVRKPLGQHPPFGGRPLIDRPRSGKVPLDHHVKHGIRLLAEDAECQAPSSVILIMWDRKGPQAGLFYPTSPDTAGRAVSQRAAVTLEARRDARSRIHPRAGCSG